MTYWTQLALASLEGYPAFRTVPIMRRTAISSEHRLACAKCMPGRTMQCFESTTNGSGPALKNRENLPAAKSFNHRPNAPPHRANAAVWLGYNRKEGPPPDGGPANRLLRALRSHTSKFALSSLLVRTYLLLCVGAERSAPEGALRRMTAPRVAWRFRGEDGWDDAASTLRA